MDSPLTRIEIESTNNKIRDNLEYMLMNFPKSYDRNKIDKNIETWVNAMCDALNIEYGNHQMVDLIWRYTTLKYTDRLVDSFKRLEENGKVPKIITLKYVDVFIDAWKDKYGKKQKEYKEIET